jgi:CheY-like chemotaxis protein
VKDDLKGNLVPKILIADDNSNIQKMVALAFEDHKIEVIAVGNGEAAVKKLPDVKPDLILADVFMPVRNGYEVCEFVKKDARFSSIPVILLVGAFDPLDEAEAKRVAADGVLKKPFVPPDPLITLVMGLLSKVMKAAAPAKAKEEAPAEPPQLMPRRPQVDPAPAFAVPGAQGADDDAYLVGRGRDADDDKWQTVTNSSGEAGAAGAPGASGFESNAGKVFAGLAAEAPEEQYGETHAEVRRRQALDNHTVPSFSSALVGEMEEHKAEVQPDVFNEASVVPNPEAEAQPAETNWAALVKSFTAAPLSISDLEPVKKHVVEEPEADEVQGYTPRTVDSESKADSKSAAGAKAGATSPSRAPAALEHLIDQVNQRAAAEPVSAYASDFAEVNEPARPERAKTSGAASSSSPSSSSSSSSASSPSSKASARNFEEKNSAETSAYSQELVSQAPEIQGSVVSPIQAKAIAQVESSVRTEAAAKPAFDESLWAKTAMQTSVPAEAPMEQEYESRSNTAAQMIAAAAEAAQEYSRRDTGFPFAVQSEGGAAVKPAPAKVETPAVVEAAPAVGYAEVVPTPREVAHVFQAPTEAKASEKEERNEAPAASASVAAVEAAPVSASAAAEVSVSELASELTTRTNGDSTLTEVQTAQEMEEQHAQQATEQAVAPPNVDEIVAKVLEKIAPQLQDLISKGVLRPLVEEVLRQPDMLKKK